MKQETIIPPAYTMQWPTLLAVRQLGGSATIQEITDVVVQLLGFTEEQQAVPHKVGSRSEIEYRLAWARTTLRLLGALQRSARGVWSLTELGRSISEEDLVRLYSEYRTTRRKQRVGVGVTTTAELETERDGDEPLPEEEEDWKSRLIAVLLSMEPPAFERLVKRVLREAGFESVEVTGRSGDGGIDGTGIYRLSLMSFPVPFQCKRWSSSVGASELRNFRGGLAGRAEHALFVTTSSFTSGAKEEAKRPGVAPIDLIDGDRLCELLKEFGLGVTSRVIEHVEVWPDFFADV